MAIDASIPLSVHPVKFNDPFAVLEDYRQRRAAEEDRRGAQQLRQQEIQLGQQRIDQEQAKASAAEQQRLTTKQIHDAAETAYHSIKDGNAEDVLSQMPPESRALAEGWLASFSESKKKRDEQGLMDAKQAAQFIRANNYDPVTSATAIHLLSDAYPAAKSLLDKVDDPAKLKPIIDHFADYGEKPQAGFTLGPGQQRFGPQGGDPIASVPVTEKPETEPQVGTFGDYLTRVAAGQGKNPKQLSPLDVRQAKAQFDAAGRAPEKPKDETGRLDRSYTQGNSALESIRKPIADQMDRFARLSETVNQSTPQADALIAPELLTVMAGGAGSGLRMNEAEISRIIGGRSNIEGLKAALNKWQLDPTKALSVTPAQRQQIRDLMGAVKQRTDAKLALVNAASQALIDAPDVETQRRIIADVRKKLDEVGNGAKASGGIKILSIEEVK